MKKWLVILAFVVAAALTAGVIVWQPWAQPAPLVAEDSSPGKAAGQGWSASASFPDEPRLRARVERADPKDNQTAALPAATNLRALADFSVEAGGQFPASGAQISFTLDVPLAAEAVPVVAHWNEDSETWDPVETTLSEDRRTATASVSHFSEYGFFDYLFNAIGQVTGNAATSGVRCEQPIPDWADPQYFDDINAPVLWCGGKDANNTDLLVAKVKLNRDTAAKVTVAIDHAWAWSDLWKTSPTDLATMADAAGLPNSPFSKRDFLIQPFGEIHFGFSRAALEALYYGKSNLPLIQVETGWFFTAAAIMWDQIGGLSGGDSPIAAASSTLAMMDCGQALLTASSASGAVDAFVKAMTCLGTQQSKDLLHRGVRTVLSDRYPHLTSGWVTVHSKKILSKFGLIGLGLNTAGFSLKIFSAAGDSTLPDNVRQFRFEPSLKAIRERAPQLKTYTDPVMGISFQYPSEWTASEPVQSIGTEGASVFDPTGRPFAYAVLGNSFDMSPCPPVNPYELLDSAPVTIPGMATTQAPTSVKTEVVNWGSAANSLDGKPVQLYIQVYSNPGHPAGTTKVCNAVGVIEHNGKYGIFSAQRGFDTVQEARAYLNNKEYAQIKAMLASLRFL